MTLTFAAPTEAIPRDRWGRPLIPPVDGGEPVGYTRASTLCKALSDSTGLMEWKAKMTAAGMAARPDLNLLAAALDVNADGDKPKWRELVEQAQEAAAASGSANRGTAIHRFIELANEGQDPETMPEAVRADIRAYLAAMDAAGLEIVASERFVVVDEVQAAGTFDHLLRRKSDGLLALGDVKTGHKELDYPWGVVQQNAIYAHGHLYSVEQGRHGHLPSLGVSTDLGYLIHVPQGTGTAQVYEFDLDVGWSLAKTAVAVRAAMKGKPLRPVGTTS